MNKKKVTTALYKTAMCTLIACALSMPVLAKDGDFYKAGVSKGDFKNIYLNDKDTLFDILINTTLYQYEVYSKLYDASKVSDIFTSNPGASIQTVHNEIVKRIVPTEINTVIQSVNVIKDTQVAYGTALANVGLPSKITLNLSDKTTKIVDVTWTSPNYDGNRNALYMFTGVYKLPSGVTGTMPAVTANVVVGAKTEQGIGIGQTVTVPNALFGTYEITINNVEFTSDRNKSDDSNPAEVYKVNYTYKLLAKGSSTNGGLLLLDCFDSVDSTGEVGYVYPGTTNNNAKELMIVGSRCTADTFIAVKNKTKSLTLVLKYQKTDGSSYVTFNLPLSNTLTSAPIKTFNQ